MDANAGIIERLADLGGDKHFDQMTTVVERAGESAEILRQSTVKRIRLCDEFARNEREMERSQRLHLGSGYWLGHHGVEDCV
jgi:hypothetical protein